MKKLAYVLMAVGVLIAVIAFNLDVTVGDTRIVNLNLMAQRQNLLLVGCVAFLAGVVLLVGVQRSGDPKSGGEKQRDAMDPQRAHSFNRPVAEFRASCVALRDHLLKDTTPSEFFVRLVCATAAAVIGANLFVATWPTGTWIYFLLFVLLFWFAMTKGLSILVLIFCVELIACLALPGLYIAFFEGQWSSFSYLAPEFLACIVGMVLATKFKRQGAPATP